MIIYNIQAYYKKMSTIRKKALLVGINYRNTESELNGCINDIINMKDVLITKFGYSIDDITVITDDTEIKPTRYNILTTLLNLLLETNSNLYFHYSRHGRQTLDLNGDESDKLDEGLVPIDYEKKGIITDDEIRGLLNCLAISSRLTIVLDCCHSGTGVDLCYNLYERIGKYYLLEDPSYKYGKTNGSVVCISGCMDSQTSADAYINKQYQGALTNALISGINTLSTKTRTLNNLYSHIKNTLQQGKYTQIPCLSSGTNININAIYTV